MLSNEAVANRQNLPESTGFLEREAAARKQKRSRRNMILICIMCITLLSIIALYYTTDYLDWAKIHNYPMKYQDIIDKYAAEYKLDPALVCGVIYTESDFDAEAVSVDGARGLMQIMPETGDWIASKIPLANYNKEQLFQPEVNIKFGCWMLNYLYTRFAGDSKKALAAYNAGQGTVDAWLKRPDCSADGIKLDHIPIKETRNYVKRVKAAHDIYQDIYYDKSDAA